MITRNLIVAIDGPRGVGKSTVCKQLVEKLNLNGLTATYFKEIRSTDPNPAAETNAMWENLHDFKSKGGIWIVDRFAASEWVMSLATGRRKVAFQLTQSCQILAEGVSFGGINVMLMATNDALDARLKARNDGRDWDLPKDVVQPMWLAASGVLNIPILDTTNMQIGQVVSILYTTVRARLQAMATQPLSKPVGELQ